LTDQATGGKYMFDEETWMELGALHRQGWSISALAEEFNLDRRTVQPLRSATNELS
jgi:hypothetical protein